MLKSLVKRLLQAPVAVAAPAALWRRRDELLILMYHRVLPKDDPRYASEQPGMRVTPDTFACHLRWLKRYFRPVQLDQWLQEQAPPGKRPACAITFDDGWQDNHEYALPLLREAGLPATVFLVADHIGTCRNFWPGRIQRMLSEPLHEADPTAWEWLHDFRLANAKPSQPPNAVESDAIITALKQVPDEVIEKHLTVAERVIGLGDPKEPAMLNWMQVREMTADGTFSVGSHTCRHRRLNADRAYSSLRDEIVRSKEVIEEKAGVTPTFFCYPNGDVSPDAETLVRENYQAACLVERGWNKTDGDPFRLKRLGMHEDVSRTRIQFLARCMGVG